MALRSLPRGRAIGCVARLVAEPFGRNAIPRSYCEQALAFGGKSALPRFPPGRCAFSRVMIGGPRLTRPTMPASLFNNYRLSPERFDEMVAPDGQSRAHWQPFLGRLMAAEDEVLDRRIQFIQDAIETDGVSYNIYGDAQGTRRLWELDPLPLLMASQEWASLSAAVAQRASLLNAMLADLYGEQRLLAEGLLPD